MERGRIGEVMLKSFEKTWEGRAAMVESCGVESSPRSLVVATASEDC